MPLYDELRGLMVAGSAGSAPSRAPLRPLTAEELERVRYPGEVEAGAKLARLRGFRRALAEYDRAELLHPLHSERRGEEMRLDEAHAPAFVFEALEDARLVLGVGEPVEIFQGPGALSAGLTPTPRGAMVTLGGPVLELLDKQELRGLFGYELGHYRMHEAPWARHRAETRVSRVWERDGPGGEGEPRWLTACAFQVACEITADRAELLVSRDLDAFLTSTLTFSTKVGEPAVTHDPGALLRQVREALGESVGQKERGRARPERYIRIRAAELFFESDVFRELTSVGPGSRPLDAVNAEVARLLLGWTPRGADTIPQERFERYLMAVGTAIASADGTFCKEEQAYLALALPLGWTSRRLAPAQVEASVDEFAEAVRTGDDTRARLLTLNFLCGLCDADGRAVGAELRAIDEVGKAIGARDIFRRELGRRYGFDPKRPDDAGRAPRRDRPEGALPPSLARYARTVALAGARTLPLRRLLHLAGLRRRTPRALAALTRALAEGHGVELAEQDALLAMELDAPVTLRVASPVRRGRHG